MDIVGSASTANPQLAAFIDELLVPGADHVDQQGVSRVTMEHLADAGLIGTSLAPSEYREVAELIARADASTWFCWVQHQMPFGILRDSDRPEAAGLRAELLEGLESGAILSGVAHAHVRRPGAPNPRANRVDDGWIINGSLDWVTAWDITDVVMVMVEWEESFLCFYLRSGEVPSTVPGVVVGEPLELLAMGGTHTRPVTFKNLHVHDSQVAAIIRADEWREADTVKTSNANPAIFGIARGAISELDDLATSRGDERTRALVNELAAECTELRSRAYLAVDDNRDVQTRLRIRAEALDFVIRACLAVITARAGAAMITGHPAERRMREALFMQVQAQTEESRAAMQDLALGR